MRVGAAKAILQLPDDFLPVEGFTSILQPLFVRTVILSGNVEVAILSVEMTSLPDIEVEMLRKLLSSQTGIGVKNCYVCVTHTFSAPHLLPDHALKTAAAQKKKAVLQQALYEAVAHSATKARDNLVETELKVGKSDCRINANRDIETPTGWWVSNCGAGPTDPTMTVLSGSSSNGQPTLLLLHYAVQSSVLDGSIMADGGKVISSDLAGSICSLLEQHYPNAVVLFLMGAAGDQAPTKKAKTLVPDQQGQWLERDLSEHGPALCQQLAHKAAKSAIQAVENAQPLLEMTMQTESLKFQVPSQQMNRNLRELQPTHSYQYISAGDQECGIEALRIGSLAFLFVKPELNCSTAQQLAQQSPFATTLVMTMVNGGAKYMADADSYDRFTYQAMNSPFGKGAAEILCRQGAELLQRLHP